MNKSITAILAIALSAQAGASLEVACAANNVDTELPKHLPKLDQTDHSVYTDGAGAFRPPPNVTFETLPNFLKKHGMRPARTLREIVSIGNALWKFNQARGQYAVYAPALTQNYPGDVVIMLIRTPGASTFAIDIVTLDAKRGECPNDYEFVGFKCG